MRELSVNAVLKSVENDHLHRVLWISSERTEAYLFDMASLEMPYVQSCSDLIRMLDNGIFLMSESDPYLILTTESELTDSKKEIRDKIWDVMKDVVADEPRIFTKKGRGELLSAVMSASGKNLMTLHRYLKMYWQRGKTKDAFVPQFCNRGAAGKERGSGELKRGRPRKYDDSVGINVDESTAANFEWAVKKFYHTRDGHTLKYSYDMMLKERYTQYATQTDNKLKALPVDASTTPTIGQFRYWYHKKYGVKDKITARKGEAKFSLDHRAITGKSDYGLMGPGARYEVDATLGDVYLVSRFDRADIIGRPVLYFVLDAFSRMVTGMYVGLEGPSWAGMMMAIANSSSDKVKYCAEYGIEITEDEWPCQGVPGSIRGDRGEFESKEADTLVNALNVRVENAPPFRADLKGIVEQHFNQINELALASLPGHVQEDMKERGGRDYRLYAKFDLHQLTKILIQCVLYHNNHHLMESYERDEDMIVDEVAPIPREIWNWGISHRSGILRRFPDETVKLALMPTDTASVTAKGIRFKNLYYLCGRAAAEHWFETARAKGTWKVNISYDPRNMSTIYVRESDGTVDECWLSEWQQKYVGKCLYEIERLRNSEKTVQRKNAPKEMASKAELTAAIEGVIAETEEMARQTPGSNSKSERVGSIRENRRREKEANRQTEAFSLDKPEAEPLAERHEPLGNAGQMSPTTAMLKKLQEEQLNGQ